MADYFLCLDAETFTCRIRPVLAESWRQHSFAPCRVLCQELLPAAQEYTRRYHIGEEASLVEQLTTDGFPFDRACWRLLAGEVLLFAAVDIPEFQTNAETLYHLLVPGYDPATAIARESFVPIQQALRGSRDLRFGSAVYRPERAGYNDPRNVARLAEYLAAIQPERWAVEDLRGLRDMDDEERADELAFVREWFPALVELYQQAHTQRRVLIIENIY
jgi:hypothetical protein